MDNLAHTLCGGALARARLVPAVPGATAALLVGANLPDVDAWYYLVGDGLGALEFRRGWTHSLLAFALEIPLLAAVVWTLVRRRAGPGAFPALLGAAALGVLSHLALDLLNTYGVRFLAPFSWRWFHGDTAFIVDPWMWLFLGLGALSTRRSAAALLAWTGIGVLGVVLMAGRGLPAPLVAVFASCVVGCAWRARTPHARALARRALALTALYLVLAKAASWTAERRALQHLEEVGELAGRPVVEVVMNPAPARPWAWTAVVGLPDEVLRVALAAAPGWPGGEPRIVHRLARHLDDPALGALEGSRELRVWRTFARVPFVARDGDRLVLGDARYSRGGAGDWANVVVPLSPGAPPLRATR